MIIDDMKVAGVKPGIIVYTCLIQTCLKANQLKTALGLFKDMKNEGIQPDSVTY